MIFGRNIQKTLEWSLHVSFSMYVCLLSRYRLSDCIPKITRACCAVCTLVSCWVHFFLQHLRRRSLWIVRKTDDRRIPSLTWNFSDCSVALTEVCLPNSATTNSDSTVSTFLSVCALRLPLPVDCSKLHQQPVDTVLRPTFVQKLCYKLPSFVTFTFLQTVFFFERHQSCLVCLIHCQNSCYFRCPIWKTKSW